MRKDGKYRFTLQFGADSEDQIRVGELLENLGNRKSTIIVSALSDYINAHPELQSGYSKIEVKVAPAFDRSQMERLIRSIVEEKLSEDLAEKCGCTTSHIGQIENGRVKPSLEMTVRIANALNATTDQLLAHEFSHPEEIYLKEIAKRIEKYPDSARQRRIFRCLCQLWVLQIY